MERDAKRAILKNRARLLNLDYFDLTAPLLASEVLPTRKHKEIKTDASSGKARVDLLLEWLDESAPKDAFASFLQGIRNCKELILAKKIKKEAAGEVLFSPVKIEPKAPKASKPSAVVAPKIKLPKLKIKSEKVEKPDYDIPFGNVVANGMEINLLTPEPTKSAKKKTPGEKPKKAKSKLNGAQKSLDITNSKVLAPKSAPTATPRSTRKSSVMTNTSLSEKMEGAANETPTSKKRKAPAAKASPAKKIKTEAVKTEPKKSRAKGEGEAKAMTFSEVEKKQEDFRQKFKFRNSDATVKTIHYNDKTDIFYQGCPTEMTKKICSKKVELKGREYVCEGKHHNTTYINIPRLYVTFNDGTGDMQLTLFKSNVETFSGKTSSDLDNMGDGEIKGVLEKSMGKKMNVEVQCDKVKKDAKKAGGAKWNNVATILTDDQGTKGVKKRKN